MASPIHTSSHRHHPEWATHPTTTGERSYWQKTPASHELIIEHDKKKNAYTITLSITEPVRKHHSKEIALPPNAINITEALSIAECLWNQYQVEINAFVLEWEFQNGEWKTKWMVKGYTASIIVDTNHEYHLVLHSSTVSHGLYKSFYQKYSSLETAKADAYKFLKVLA